MAKPTHILKARSKKDDKTFNNRIGVGWETADGWIEIKLDPCVVLHWQDDVYINLYPKDATP
jgi:hypothetical protein